VYLTRPVQSVDVFDHSGGGVSGGSCVSGGGGYAWLLGGYASLLGGYGW